MFNATPQHSYSRVPVEPLDQDEIRASQGSSFWSRVTFGWVAGRLSTTEQQSHDGLVPRQRSARWNFRHLHYAWIKHAASAQASQEVPRLWKVVVSFVFAEDCARFLSLPIFILCARVLQPVMFASILSLYPFLLYGSHVPWICAVIVGFWLAVSVEGFARSHYAYLAHLTSASVKSGLTGLVHDKVIDMHKVRKDRCTFNA